jgi:hypothetical protein
LSHKQGGLIHQFGVWLGRDTTTTTTIIIIIDMMMMVVVVVVVVVVSRPSQTPNWCMRPPCLWDKGLSYP